MDQNDRAKELMKAVYKDGFNIYQCLNRVKKNLKRKEDFPVEAIIWTCESYLKDPPKVKNHWTWFVTTFTQCSARYFSEQHCKESEARHRDRGGGGIPQSLKDIMKGIGNG